MLKIEPSEISSFFYNNFFNFGGGGGRFPPWRRLWIKFADCFIGIKLDRQDFKVFPIKSLIWFCGQIALWAQALAFWDPSLTPLAFQHEFTDGQLAGQFDTVLWLSNFWKIFFGCRATPPHKILVKFHHLILFWGNLPLFSCPANCTPFRNSHCKSNNLRSF